MNDVKDMLQYLFSVYKEDKAIFIDIPRGLNHTATHKFYSALETIKSGYLFNLCFKGKYRFINPPCIYVFCNNYPDVKHLSYDR